MDYVTSLVISNAAPTIFAPAHPKYGRVVEIPLIDNTSPPYAGAQELTYTIRDTKDDSIVDSGSIFIPGELLKDGLMHGYPFVMLRPLHQLELQTSVGDMFVFGIIRAVRGAAYRIPSQWVMQIPPTS